MAKTRIEKIEEIEARVAQMVNEKNELLKAQKEADRKARDHRVCKRGGFIESVLPDIITFTDEQFKLFIRKTLTTDYAKNILLEIETQPAEPPTENPKNAETPAAQAVQQNKAAVNQSQKN
jgi:hypothetical protein